MSPSESGSELVLELAEEFLDRYHKGERLQLKEYIDRHPALAAEIREVFAATAIAAKAAAKARSLGEKAKPNTAWHRAEYELLATELDAALPRGVK